MSISNYLQANYFSKLTQVGVNFCWNALLFCKT